MLEVEIQNSWQVDLIRLYKGRGDFKRYYYNHVVAEVFKKSGAKNLAQDLMIFFFDNHFCNADNLDYHQLHAFLSKFFRSVEFISDNIYDMAVDPVYWKAADSVGAKKKKFHDESIRNKQIEKFSPNKMFGLHILRPDVHRLGLLVELHRLDLLDHVDVRLGFRSKEFTMLEYRRSSNIDTVCFDFDICHRELFDLIDSLPMGDRINFQDNATYRGDAHMSKDIEKNQYHRNFAIEIVCASSCHDHVFDFGEKIMRPMLLEQPFIWIGSANILKLLKKSGFKTFDHVWNESWDHYPEDWLPTKIKEISGTCNHIVKNYSKEEIQEKTKPQTDWNLDCIRHFSNNVIVPKFEEISSFMFQ